MSDKFSLKDHLFNATTVEKLAAELLVAYPAFNSKSFTQTVLAKFPELELKARIAWISETLKQHLPPNYPDALAIVLAALPAPCDPSKTDNDFGSFTYAAYGDFVAKNGCTKPHLTQSLEALKAITTRFSAEDAIRPFLNAFPNETLAVLKHWTQDKHYHVRRLVSEGTRPKLPWAPKIFLDPRQALPLLDALFADSTRYVTRSVANHLNDIAKLDPGLVLKTLDRWQTSKRQTPAEMAYLCRHALRGLIKAGHADTLRFLNYSPEAQVSLSHFSLEKSVVKIGEALVFSLELRAQKAERVVVDYVLHFQNKAGEMASKKVYKLTECTLQKGEPQCFSKRHPLRANMTTRPLFPGAHRVDIQINGQCLGSLDFELI
ncbi:MAG: DNA alkylation repair protein [Candidatus Margulisiibacteriota bacterium]